MTAETLSTALPAHRIDLVDEEDAWCVLPGHLEHVTDTRRTNSDEHFKELGAGNGDERYIGLSSRRLCKHCFTSTGRAR